MAKMYILVNSDLNMSPGKIASQVAHITQLITDEIVRSGYESRKVPDSYFKYMKWCKCPTKIILKANTSQLKELIRTHRARYIIDDGITEVPKDSLTVIGFYPDGIDNDILKNFKKL